MNICLILSAGMSLRFGNSGLPKQYAFLNGAEVLSYSVNAMKKSKCAHKILCTANAGQAQRLVSQYGVDVTDGGPTRNHSLRNGLEYIRKQYPSCEKILIHEAARPFIGPELVDSYFQKLGEYDAVITAQHLTDSLGRYGEPVTDRSEYYLVQAPEAFRFDLLYRHFQADSPITATGQQLPPDCTVFRNFDFPHNLKITYPEDLIIAEALMRYRNDKVNRA